MPSEHVTDSTKTLLPYDFGGLTDELKRRLRDELHENDETRVNGLKTLRNLLNEDSKLTYPDDDSFLLPYLRARKYDVKRAASTLKAFFHAHKKFSDVYKNYDFATVVKTMDENTLGFLPYRDQEGSVILIMHVGKWDPYAVSMADAMRTLTAGLFLSIRDPATQVAGFKVIVDFKGFTLRQLPHVSPTLLLLLAEALQNCFPGRFRGVHLVNEGPLFSYIWAVLKTFLTKKLKDRFVFHGKNIKTLHQYMTPAALPEEYGGELGPFDNSEWAKKVKHAEAYVMSMFDYGYLKTKGSVPN